MENLLSLLRETKGTSKQGHGYAESKTTQRTETKQQSYLLDFVKQCNQTKQ